MFIQKKIECIGASGKIYTFEVYPKSARLPETGGIYLLAYCHPRGHLSGFQVNILRMGVADNLNAVIDGLRQKADLLKECWNYTGIMCLDADPAGCEYIEDLSAVKAIQC